MKSLVILGAGTAGTMMANHLHKNWIEKNGILVLSMKEKNTIINLGIFFTIRYLSTKRHY